MPNAAWLTTLGEVSFADLTIDLGAACTVTANVGRIG
jgi:hypothetical protein